MEDREIVDLYWARNEKAIGETMKKYGALCHGIAQNILASHEDAAECVNDVWLKAWESMPPQRPNSLRAWLCQVVRNIALNRWKKEHAMKRYDETEQVFSMEQMAEEMQECVPSPENTEQVLEAKELSTYLSQWLRTLPQADRVLFLRRYWYGNQVKDLAKERGETPASVAMRLMRLRTKLKESLEEEGYHL